MFSITALIPRERRLRRVSKDAWQKLTPWFETPREMRCSSP